MSWYDNSQLMTSSDSILQPVPQPKAMPQPEPVINTKPVEQSYNTSEMPSKPLAVLDPSYKVSFYRLRDVNPGCAEEMADFVFKLPFSMMPMNYKEILDAYIHFPELYEHAYVLKPEERKAMIEVYKKNEDTATRMSNIFIKGVSTEFLPWKYKNEIKSAMRQLYPNISFDDDSCPSYITKLQKKSTQIRTSSDPVDPYLEVALSRIWLLHPGKANDIIPYVYTHSYHEMTDEYKEILEKFMDNSHLTSAYFPGQKEKNVMEEIFSMDPEIADIIANFFIAGVPPEQLPCPIKKELEFYLLANN